MSSCILKIVPGCIFNRNNPIVVGLEVIKGSANVGSKLFQDGNIVELGTIASIEFNHNNVETAQEGQRVVMKITSIAGIHDDNCLIQI